MNVSASEVFPVYSITTFRDERKMNQVFETNELSPNNAEVAIPGSNSLIQTAVLQGEFV